MKWQSPPPKACDICHEPTSNHDHFVDGKTIYGPWAIMCPTCHSLYGCGLGTGKGQKYSTDSLQKLEG